MNMKLFDAIKVKMPKLPKTNIHGNYAVVVATPDDWNEHWSVVSLHEEGEYWVLNDNGDFTGSCIGNVSLNEADCIYWFDSFEQAKSFRKIFKLRNEIFRIFEEDSEVEVDYWYTSKELFDAFFRWAVTRTA